MALMNDMKERGIELPWGGDEEEPRQHPRPSRNGVLRRSSSPPSWTLPPFADQKRACMDCHKTQRQDMGWLLDLPADLQARAISPEFYVLRKWRDREVPDGYRETSVFD